MALGVFMFGVRRFSASIHHFNRWVFRPLPWFKAFHCLKPYRTKAIPCMIGMSFSYFWTNLNPKRILKVFGTAKFGYLLIAKYWDFLIARFGYLYVARFECLIDWSCDKWVKSCVRWWVFWNELGYIWWWMRGNLNEWTHLNWFVLAKIALTGVLASSQCFFL